MPLKSCTPRTRLHHQALLVAQELLLDPEEHLVGVQELLRTGADLLSQTLALAGLGLEHLLVLHLDHGLVGDVALYLEGADRLAGLVIDRYGREDEAELAVLAAGDPTFDLVETHLPPVLPALLGDAVVLTNVQLQHVE